MPSPAFLLQALARSLGCIDQPTIDAKLDPAPLTFISSPLPPAVGEIVRPLLLRRIRLDMALCRIPLSLRLAPEASTRILRGREAVAHNDPLDIPQAKR